MLILIDNGRILFNAEKDELLDTHALVKGDNQFINEKTKKLFITLRQSQYGFEGITNKKTELRQLIPDILTERPTIEDVILAYVRGNINAN